ncbi:MAG: nucleoside triphosphate pyrophosphatase [Pyrinomonadaceae bacterium]
MLKLPKLILASGSPRRAEILNAVGWEFEKYSADIDETEFVGEKPKDYVQRLAQTKAVTIAEKYPGALVLGADTIVVIDNKIIGKPKDLAEAEKMLRTLSGKWHEVLTGVALVIFLDGKQKTKVRQQRTRVKFAEINDAEIKLLVEKGEPLDKAGAYAVQAQAALFIEEIEGDYWNVVGLPINLVYKMLDAY